MANNDILLEESAAETAAETATADSYYDTLTQVSNEIFTNPLNVVLLSISAFLLYKIVAGRQAQQPEPEPEVKLPRMKKKDLTLDELKQYNGTNVDGRICIAVNSRIYDVTRGKQFYGPGGPYSIFAGRDASRALALFTVSESALKSENDDLSDLTSAEMSRMREWQIQLEEKYDFVGRLLKPGQEPADYTDSEEELNPNDEGDGDEKEAEEKSEKKEELESKTGDINTKEKVDDVEEKKPEKPKDEKTEEEKQPQDVEKEIKEEETSTKKTEL